MARVSKGLEVQSEMLPILMALLVFISIITILAVVVRSMMGLWLDYKAKMAILDRMSETGEDVPKTTEELEKLVTRPAVTDATRGRVRMTTGALMMWFGVGSVVAGRILRSGTIAVGLDLGGWISIGVGLAVLAAGLIVWRIGRSAEISANSVARELSP